MAADKSTDILMMLVQKGKPVPADCQTQFSESAMNDGRSLLTGFVPGFFFEIEDIDLDLDSPAPDGQAATTGKTSSGVTLKDITVTRQIDRASMILMQALIGSTDFDSASIIKRRAVGGSIESGQAYLRFDFDGVLLTRIDWMDQHVVKEKCTFITRGLTMRYRPQSADGSLGDVSQTKWTIDT